MQLEQRETSFETVSSLSGRYGVNCPVIVWSSKVCEAIWFLHSSMLQIMGGFNSNNSFHGMPAEYLKLDKFLPGEKVYH